MKRPVKKGVKRQAVFVVNTGGKSGGNLVVKYLSEYHFRHAASFAEADLIILPDGFSGASNVPAQLHGKTVILESLAEKITMEAAIKAVRDDGYLDIRAGANFSKEPVVAYITIWLNKLAEG